MAGCSLLQSCVVPWQLGRALHWLSEAQSVAVQLVHQRQSDLESVTVLLHQQEVEKWLWQWLELPVGLCV